MTEDGGGRNLLGQPYPKERARRACHQPRHRQRSSQRRWGRRPGEGKKRSERGSGQGQLRMMAAVMPEIGHVIGVWDRVRGKAHLREGALGEDTARTSQ